MEKDILQRISEECAGYSKRQRAIARYICDNSEVVSFMTAQMLSQATEVSESSVVRFARQLGFGGYTELRRALQQRIKKNLAAQEEAPEKSSREFAQLIADGAFSLNSLLTPQNERALGQAQFLLTRAEHIVVQAGLGMEGLDRYFAASLRTMRFPAVSVSEGGTEELLNVNEKSVLVSIGGHYVSTLVGPIKYAKARNAVVLALAEDEMSPVRQYTNMMLLGKGPTAIVMLLTALIAALEKNSGSTLETNLTELDTLHREYATYEFKEN